MRSSSPPPPSPRPERGRLGRKKAAPDLGGYGGGVGAPRGLELPAEVAAEVGQRVGADGIRPLHHRGGVQEVGQQQLQVPGRARVVGWCWE